MNQLNRPDCTTAFKLEEVSYPNTITFNVVSNVEGVNNLATFSAPFATVVPEGVTAYYVETTDRDESTATMKAIEAGKAIPANAGVILTSTTGDEATMIPATTETAADLTGNKLGNLLVLPRQSPKVTMPTFLLMVLTVLPSTRVLLVQHSRPTRHT